jgi:predicted CoA-binding protein
MPDVCELPLSNASDVEIKAILSSAKIVAVVGLSDNPERDSYRVASYLKLQGYQIIPINPNAKEVLGEKAYPDLRSVPTKIDVVDIFRKVDAVPGIVNEAIGVGARVVWMQEGIVHNASADMARSNGLQVVMGKCMMKEHRRAFGSWNGSRTAP